MGFDYFYFYPQDADDLDYFQSYYWSPEHDNAQADLGFYVEWLNLNPVTKSYRTIFPKDFDMNELFCRISVGF